MERIGRVTSMRSRFRRIGLTVTRLTAQVRSDQDGHYLTLGRRWTPSWEGQQSLSYLGRGDVPARSGEQSELLPQLLPLRARCNASSATNTPGLLKREKREQVEVLFKTGKEADAPNLLTCTPTLEMGIDVGDLVARWSARFHRRQPTTSNVSDEQDERQEML